MHNHNDDVNNFEKFYLKIKFRYYIILFNLIIYIYILVFFLSSIFLSLNLDISESISNSN